MPELPACFQDYNHFRHSLKTRSVLSCSTDSLVKPDNNQKITTQNTIDSTQSATYNPLAPAGLRPPFNFVYLIFIS